MNQRRSIEVAPETLRRVREVRARPGLARLRVSESRLLALALEYGVPALERLVTSGAQIPLNQRPERPNA